MRDPERIDRILDKLGQVWKRQPDLRLGQLIIDLHPRGDFACPEVFHVEDDSLECQIDRFLKEGRFQKGGM